MRSERIMLTPEMAKTFLQRRWDGQRPLIEQHVRRLQSEMEADQYMFNPFHPLGFDMQGRLVEGQHTCEAVIRSGHSIEVDVIYDVPAALVPKLGANVGWSLADRLGLADVRGCKVLSDTRNRRRLVPVVNAIFQHLHSGSPVTPTDTEALAVASYYAHGLEWHLPNAGNKLLRNRHVGAALVMAQRAQPGSVEQFVPKVLTGAGLNRHDPALTLRDYLMALKEHKDTGTATFKKVMRALQAYCQGEKIARLVWKDGQRDAIEFFVGKVGTLREAIGVGRATRKPAQEAERRYVIQDGERVTIEAARKH